MDLDAPKNLNHVEAGLSYLDTMAEKPSIYLYEPPPGVPVRSGHSTRHTMTIYDLRGMAEPASLDVEGFTLVHRGTAVKDFYDDQEVKSVYYPEVERLMLEVTGAEKILVFDHNVRSGPAAKRGDKGIREPVRYAHNDYTLKSGPQRVRDLLPADEAEERIKHRFAMINIWRPIRGPVMDTPLAVCDARTIAQSDFVATDLKYRDRTGEVYSMSFNPAHRWFYVSRMERDEVLLLKCFDSEPSRTRFTAHSAFDDPTCPPDAPARESIEIRTIAFFAPRV
ncbi:MAG TPA: CmcJ/NvfI family oxidoreductase [Candidatus Binataceae bacterium]|nr:CmcJ/NvfI family oxidoreductase [Candidatus Binataceae bacterium]